jgi:O-methyltransferase involved in polyketide biosynthesis
MYLNITEVNILLRQVSELAAPGSWLGTDAVNSTFLTSPLLRPWLRVTATYGAPWRFGTDTPEALLETHRWKATATQPGEEGANYRRWPFVIAPRPLAKFPRIFLIAAQRMHEHGSMMSA